MSEKNEKKLRNLVRKHENILISNTWDMFFETMAKLKFKYRLKMAWKILVGEKVVKKNESGYSGNKSNSNKIR